MISLALFFVIASQLVSAHDISKIINNTSSNSIQTQLWHPSVLSLNNTLKTQILLDDAVRRRGLTKDRPIDHQRRIKKDDEREITWAEQYRQHLANAEMPPQSKIATMHKKVWSQIESGMLLNHTLPVLYEDHPYSHTTSSSSPLHHPTVSYMQQAPLADSFVTSSHVFQNQKRPPLLTQSNTAPLRIHFSTLSFSEDEDNGPLTTLRQYILPRVNEIWSKHLRVIPVSSPIITPRESCYGYIPSDAIPRSFRKDGVPDADLVAFVLVEDCGGTGSLAYAFPCHLDEYDRPVVGLVSFCQEALPDITVVGEDRVRRFADVAVHEFGHVLGVTATLFPYFRDRVTGEALTPRPLEEERMTCVDGNKRRVVVPSESIMKRVNVNGYWEFEIVTETVKKVVQNQFGCDSLEGARLENQPTNILSCFGSHWDERMFYTELMGPIYSTSDNVFSALTLALLEDSGWYIANYTDVKISPWGHGAGCDFVNEPCIINGGSVPTYGTGFFCNRVTKLYVNSDTGSRSVNGDYMCNTRHTHKALCDLFFEEFNPPPDKFRYFSTSRLSPALDQADFCPVPRLAEVDCEDGNMRSYLGRDEVFGPGSRCFDMRGEELGSICMPAFCNPETKKLEVTVRRDVVVCDYDGQVHSLSKDRTYFYCPRLASVCPDFFCPSNCSGRGTCNWSATPVAQCECFDPRDDTPGCYGAPATMAPSLSPSAAPSVPPSTGPTVTPTATPTVTHTVVPSVTKSEFPSSVLLPAPTTVNSSQSVSPYVRSVFEDDRFEVDGDVSGEDEENEENEENEEEEESILSTAAAIDLRNTSGCDMNHVRWTLLFSNLAVFIFMLLPN